MQLHVTIYKINDTQAVSEKFKKREFIVEIEKQTPYPQFIKIEVTQDKTEMLDKFSEGQEVSVDFNLRGLLFNGNNGEQCFTTLQAWKVEAV